VKSDDPTVPRICPTALRISGSPPRRQL
jgi:hypothetical protein